MVMVPDRAPNLRWDELRVWNPPLHFVEDEGARRREVWTRILWQIGPESWG